MQILLASELKMHFLYFLNRILVGELDPASGWFESRVAFLAKTARPSLPKDLRPTVLSPVTCKIFTKLRLKPMKPGFPPMVSGQILGEDGGQVLDGALAVQHSIRLASERKQPLLCIYLRGLQHCIPF